MKTLLNYLLLVFLCKTLAVRDRTDQRCGPGYPAPDGTPEAVCLKYSQNPCCSSFGWCGSGDEYCKCDGCKDFRDWRDDLRCGPGYPAPSGKEEAICNKYTGTPCCSYWGWCGGQDEYCKCYGCTDYRTDWRNDGRCGPGYPASSGKTEAICNKNSLTPCCSKWEWCGRGDQYCKCDGCTDYRDWRDDGHCGSGYPAPSGEGDAICNPNSGAPCCSNWGWCGSGDLYCNCDGCTDYRTGVNGLIESSGNKYLVKRNNGSKTFYGMHNAGI